MVSITPSANDTVQIGHKLRDWIEAVLGVTSTGLNRSGCFEAGHRHHVGMLGAWSHPGGLHVSFHVSGLNLCFHASILDCRGVETFYLAVTAHTMYIYIYTYTYITLPAKFSQVCPNFWGRHPAFCSTLITILGQPCHVGEANNRLHPRRRCRLGPVNSMRRCYLDLSWGYGFRLGVLSQHAIYIYIYNIYTCPQNMALF